jgi:hypothetical protein
MFGETIHSRASEPSFYYAMLAATCFRRTARNSNPTALREIGCKYLAKACGGVRARRNDGIVMLQIKGRQPWTVD